MSATQDEDKRRKRSLEAGREMLEMYKAKRSRKDKDGNMESGEQSDDEFLHNEKSMVTEGISLRDIMHSSISISEGEVNTDLEELAGGVADFEELLQGKEAIFESSNVEIDHLRAGSFTTSSPNSSQRQASSTHGRDTALYHKELNQRDNYIESLKSSLKQAISSRNAAAAQIKFLSSMELNNPVINNLQRKIEVLETTISEREAIIHKLNSNFGPLLETIRTLEIEKDINNLNEQICLGAAIDETKQQRREERVDRMKQQMQHILNKFNKELTSKNQAEIIILKAKHDEGIKKINIFMPSSCLAFKIISQHLVFIPDRLNKELPDLESKHAREVSVLQTQLANYKKKVKALKLESMNRAESQKVAQNEKELLNEQIVLHKTQLQEMTSENSTLKSILKSKESIEQLLKSNVDALKQENDTLKIKLENQLSDRTLSGRFYETEKSLSRFDAASVSTVSEIEESMYKTFDEEAIVHQLTLQKFEERMERLFVEKVLVLEADLTKANNKLEQAEKQMKDMQDKYEKQRKLVSAESKKEVVT